jgi:uncharacterized protein YecE (DUF72 family)
MYDDWRGVVYPERLPKRRWLEAYAERFGTVEVNSTFYRLARREAVAAWVEQTPPDFLFAVKASRYLTHIRRLREPAEGIARFYEPLEPLREAGRLGPTLWQLPENFHRDDARLAELLEVLPAGRHAVEFRHASWLAPEVLRMLRTAGTALAIADHPTRSFGLREAAPGWRYVRLHAGTRGRRGNYSATEIKDWARRIAQWRRHGDVFAYFNNDWEGFAPANAAALERRLRPD